MLLVLLVYSTRAVGAVDQQAHVLLTNSTRTLDQQHAYCKCCWSIVEDQRCAPLITTLWFPIGRRRKKRTSSAGSYSWHRPALASHPQTPQCPARCAHHPRLSVHVSPLSPEVYMFPLSPAPDKRRASMCVRARIERWQALETAATAARMHAHQRHLQSLTILKPSDCVSGRESEGEGARGAARLRDAPRGRQSLPSAAGAHETL